MTAHAIPAAFAQAMHDYSDAHDRYHLHDVQGLCPTYERATAVLEMARQWSKDQRAKEGR